MHIPAFRVNKSMNKTVQPRPSKGKEFFWRRCVLIFMLTFSIVSGLAALSLPATASSMVANEQNQSPAPTPTADPNASGNTPRSLPFLAIVVLLAPLAYLAWHSRGSKTPIATGSCGAPVVDGYKRPFQIFDDEAPLEDKRK